MQRKFAIADESPFASLRAVLYESPVASFPDHHSLDSATGTWPVLSLLDTRKNPEGIMLQDVTCGTMPYVDLGRRASSIRWSFKCVRTTRSMLSLQRDMRCMNLFCTYFVCKHRLGYIMIMNPFMLNPKLKANAEIVIGEKYMSLHGLNKE
jgi:hypothetical protein